MTRSFAPGARLETLPLITCFPSGTLGSQVSGTSVSFAALLYLGVMRLDASAARLEKSPDTTRTCPAGSTSFHQGPCAPRRVLCSGLTFPWCSGATLVMWPEVGPLGHPPPKVHAAPKIGHDGDEGLPGRHAPDFLSNPQLREATHASQPARVAQTD